MVIETQWKMVTYDYSECVATVTSDGYRAIGRAGTEGRAIRLAKRTLRRAAKLRDRLNAAEKVEA